MEQIFIGLSSFGTLLVAIATFLTVKELSKQRKEMYKPKLTAIENIFLISEGFGFFPKVENYHDYKKNVEPKFERSVLVRVLNIGLGPAVDVKWRFLVPIESLLNEIRAKDPTFKASYGINEYSKQEVLNIETGFHSVTLQNEGKVEFMAPEPAKSELFIEVPAYLLILFEKLIELELFEKLEIPFQLEIKFRDIGGRLETHLHELSFRMVAFKRSKEKEKPGRFHGILTVTELKEKRRNRNKKHNPALISN